MTKKLLIGTVILFFVACVVLYFTVFKNKKKPSKYNCVEGKCIQDINGSFVSQKDCTKACEKKPTLIKKYSCSGPLGSCVENKNGKYTDKKCQGKCSHIVKSLYGCLGTPGVCMKGAGTKTLQECKKYCGV